MPDANPGDIFAALYAAHLAGDYWAQTEQQAADKGLPGWRGRRACAAHVASMTACKTLALAVLHAAGQKVAPRRAVFALAADAASHYLADRRSVTVPSGLPKLAFALGKGGFWVKGTPRDGHDDKPCLGTGGHYLDQAAHVACLFAAAVAAAPAGKNAERTRRIA